MDIKQLTYFLTIAEAGSISKAAEKLHMAQPPLSHQLKLLEQELNVKLFERNTRKLQITPEGLALSHRAKQMLQFMDTTVKEVKDISKGLQGTLSIGTVSSAGAALLPSHIQSFLKKYPNINFQILDESTNKIVELLHNGVIDIGIVCTPYNNEMLEAINLANEPMVAVGTKLPWKTNKKSIALTDIKNEHLIVQERYEKNIVELCRKSAFDPKIFCKSNDVRTLLLWASNGIGLAIVPKICISLIQNQNLKFIEINEPSLSVGTAIIWEKNRYLSSAARHFLETFASK